jgi:flavin-dependent thymidylate synthase
VRIGDPADPYYHGIMVGLGLSHAMHGKTATVILAESPACPLIVLLDDDDVIALPSPRSTFGAPNEPAPRLGPRNRHPRRPHDPHPPDGWHLVVERLPSGDWYAAAHRGSPDDWASLGRHPTEAAALAAADGWEPTAPRAPLRLRAPEPDSTAEPEPDDAPEPTTPSPRPTTAQPLEPHMTRPRSPSLAPLIGVPLDVLDNGTGYIRVVDYMGTDASVARAARVSYARQDADRGAEADGKLIRYLMRHRHTSPFEMARIVLHVRLPIFVARQWMRHRTWSFNEVSARYTTLPDDVYVPDLADICGPPTDNKQGRGRPLPTGEASEAWEVMATAADHATRAVALLTVGAATDAGPAAFDLPAVAPEIARMVGPVCQYTEMTASPTCTTFCTSWRCAWTATPNWRSGATPRPSPGSSSSGCPRRGKPSATIDWRATA